MKTNALKYLWSYIIPLTLVLVLYLRGLFSFSGVLIAFFAIPILEIILKGSAKNMNEHDESTALKNSFYDFILYSHLPILWGMLAWYFYTVANLPLHNYEYWGISLSMGIFLGAMGINVAHELGHRDKAYERFIAKLLLLPNLYMHFIIEHNRGHHVNIATKEDPASARYNEMLYSFWIRSVTMTYVSAWRLEAKRLRNEGKRFLSIQNEMIIFQIVQLAYLFLVWYFGGFVLLLSAILIAVVGFLLLETVNYIEHYGLSRKKMENGRYERVQPWHSWNSDHVLGRLILFELSRHSDHHFKANRKYQVLRHFDESPQLPYGYPMSMLMSFVPPLWFAIMNPRVKALEGQVESLPKAK
jgi:alkane 1-monooxygenase